jgi:hypothetical protein
MKRLLALTFAATALWPAVAAYADDDEEPDPASDEEPDPKEDPADKAPPKPAPGKKDEFIKQDLTGHDQSGTEKANLFEKDRFFVDKVDDKKTAKSTLVQGSLTSTSFAYKESGGQIAGGSNTPAASQFSRLFTDLRLQADFRHIAGGNWDARVDARARGVSNPGTSYANSIDFTPPDSRSQSGLLGENELEVRELWLIRSGKRSDLIFGRQFVADLAGVKIDGLRVDYASSEKLTFLGFAGLFPIRGSRSITSDYTPLVANADDAGQRAAAGRFTGTGGFGAAYRTANAYGSFGGVAQVPLQAESPRVFGVAQGYWRANPKVDFYHFLVLDLVGSNTDNAGLTNLSLGANFKPDQRLRATIALNRVDTETLNVQANAFLQDPDIGQGAGTIIQNEAFLQRVAQNSARGSVSAGLGNLQRFEVTVASALRYRGEIVLPALGGAPGMGDVTLPAGKSVEVYGSVTDRRSFKKLRIGIDGSRIFKVGGDSYQRTSSNSFRGFVSRELKDGHGEWEAEASYTQTKDDKAGTACDGLSQLTCFGSATSKGLMLGGNFYYRFSRDWFAMTNLFLTRQSVTTMTSGADPAITGISGFVRASYRF